jgi:hypothetical protein
MKGVNRHQIVIMGVTLLVFSFSTSGHSGTLYRCVNSQGSSMITDTPPTDPDYKCTFGASYRDLTPQEREKEQREAETNRKRVREEEAKQEAAKQEAARRAKEKKQEAENRRANPQSPQALSLKA